MKTIFFRMLEDDDKATALLAAVRDSARSLGRHRFEVDPRSFQGIPRSPFAYWVSERLRALFTTETSLRQLGYSVNQGLITADDVRFLRLRWEVEGAIGWSGLAKGSTARGFAAEFATAVRTKGAFSDLIASANQKYPYLDGGAAKMLHATPELFGSPGLGYTRRTTSRFRTIAIPGGMCFSDKLPLISRASDQNLDELLLILGITSSRVFAYLLELSLGAADAAARSYETGLVEAVPVPALSRDKLIASIAALAQTAWGHCWRSLRSSETSQAFTLPALLQVDGTDLITRAAAWSEQLRAVDSELSAIQAEIDERCFELYGIAEADRRTITGGFGGNPDAAASEHAADDQDDPSDDGEEIQSNADVADLAAELVSWTVGVAFGRFDVRLAIGVRALPAEPGPFDHQPACAPGMLTSDAGLPIARLPAGYPLESADIGALVDDPGHEQDLTAASRAVFDIVFRAESDHWWTDVSALLDPKSHDLRTWLATSFFEHHLKRYSKSRRKAPILWQLGTPSGRYSVWLYAHRVTPDTFFQLQNQTDGIIAKKLAHEDRRLASLMGDAGGTPSARERSEIAAQSAFVAELRAMLDEAKRVAPLWNPKVEDGVVLTMAPLWRLVPQHKAWQKELKGKWDELVAGKHDWAHLAMHLWPERVVPKCTTDRSLSIAHGLEAVFWEAEADGKWKLRATPTRPVPDIVRERTSAAVKAALKSLLDAPAAMTAGGRGSGRRKGTSAADGENH